MTCDSQRHLSVNDFKGSICLNLSVTSNCFTFKCLDRFCNSTGTSEAICCRSTALSSGQKTECEGEFDNLSFNYMFFLKLFFHRNAHFSQSTHGRMLSSHISSLSHRRCFPFSLTHDNWQAKLNVVSTLFSHLCQHSYSFTPLKARSKRASTHSRVPGVLLLSGIKDPSQQRVISPCLPSAEAVTLSLASVSWTLWTLAVLKRQRSSEGPWVCPTYITGNWRKPHCGPKQPCHGLESHVSASETELWPSHFSPGPRFYVCKKGTDENPHRKVKLQQRSF